MNRYLKGFGMLQFLDGLARFTTWNPAGREHVVDFPIASEKRYWDVWHVVHSREDGQMPAQNEVQPDLWDDAVRLKCAEIRLQNLRRGGRS